MTTHHLHEHLCFVVLVVQQADTWCEPAGRFRGKKRKKGKETKIQGREKKKKKEGRKESDWRGGSKVHRNRKDVPH